MCPYVVKKKGLTAKDAKQAQRAQRKKTNVFSCALMWLKRFNRKGREGGAESAKKPSELCVLMRPYVVQKHNRKWRKGGAEKVKEPPKLCALMCPYVV